MLEAVADLVRPELRFVRGRERPPPDDTFETVVVLGDEQARSILLGRVSHWDAWAPLLAPRHLRCGAYWLPEGSHEWDAGMPTWVPHNTPDPSIDAWRPEDALLLPLRDPDGRLLGVMAVDEPLSGRRPTDEELGVLMAVADHTGLVMSLDPSLVLRTSGQGSTGVSFAVKAAAARLAHPDAPSRLRVDEPVTSSALNPGRRAPRAARAVGRAPQAGAGGRPVDRGEPLPDPRELSFAVALGSEASVIDHGRSWIRHELGARGRRGSRPAGPRHLLRRAGAGRRRRARVPAARAGDRLDRGRDAGRRAHPRRPVGRLARGRLRAAAAGL